MRFADIEETIYGLLFDSSKWGKARKALITMRDGPAITLEHHPYTGWRIVTPHPCGRTFTMHGEVIRAARSLDEEGRIEITVGERGDSQSIFYRCYGRIVCDPEDIVSIEEVSA